MKMSDAVMDAILGYLTQSREVLQAAIDDPAFRRAIHDIAAVTANALRDRRKLLLAGNGSSAGDAQHIAGRCCRGSTMTEPRRQPSPSTRSFLIGDQESDCAAATAAGITSHLFRGGNLLDFVSQVMPSVGPGTSNSPRTGS